MPAGDGREGRLRRGPCAVDVMESAKGESILRALVRTGFDETGLPWDRYTPESGRTPPYDGEWPWVILRQDDGKEDVLGWLGPAAPRPDGVFVRPMNVRRETGWGPPCAKRSCPERLRFVSPWNHPQWLGLRWQVESRPADVYHWVDRSSGCGRHGIVSGGRTVPMTMSLLLAHLASAAEPAAFVELYGLDWSKGPTVCGGAESYAFHERVWIDTGAARLNAAGVPTAPLAEATSELDAARTRIVADGYSETGTEPRPQGAQATIYTRPGAVLALNVSSPAYGFVKAVIKVTTPGCE